MRRIKNKLSDVLSQIHTSSAQIAAGSSQVSDGAQALAQGATEQASSVQELAATVHDISQNVDGNSGCIETVPLPGRGGRWTGHAEQQNDAPNDDCHGRDHRVL